MLLLIYAILKSRLKNGIALSFKILALSSFFLSLAFLTSALIRDFGYERVVSDYSSDGETVRVSVTVTDILSSSENHNEYKARLNSIDGEDVSGEEINVSFAEFASANLTPGERVSFDAVVSPSVTENDLSSLGDMADGIYLSLTVSDESSISLDGEDKKAAFIYDAKIKVRRSLRTLLSEDSYALSSALFFGDRSYLSYNDKSAFAHLGISHILAVSGLHVSVISAIVFILLSKSRMARHVKGSLALLFALFFVYVSGFSPSAIRAIAMNLVLFVSQLFGRSYDLITSLLFSVTLISLFSPGAIIDLSLLLSFSATLGIALIATAFPLNTVKSRPVKYILSSLLITLSAVIATFPISLLVFGEISLASPISNLIAVPFVTVFLFLIFVLSLVLFIPVLNVIISGIVNIIAIPFFLAVRYFSEIPFLSVKLRYPFAPLLTLIFVAITVLIFFVFKRPQVKILIAFLVFTLVFASFAIAYDADINSSVGAEILSTDHGDYILLRSKEKYVLLDLSSGDGKSGDLLYEILADIDASPSVKLDTVVLLSPSRYTLNTIKKHLSRTDHQIKNIVLLSEVTEYADRLAREISSSFKVKILKHESVNIKQSALSVSLHSPFDNTVFARVRIGKRVFAYTTDDSMKIPFYIDLARAYNGDVYIKSSGDEGESGVKIENALSPSDFSPYKYRLK